MTASLKRARSRAAAAQHRLCYYCGLPMWESNLEAFARKYSLTTGQARLLRCTAEHLHARSDGGSNASGNLVAACRYCNAHRHMTSRPLDPIAYQQYVSRRMRKGGWLAAVLPQVERQRS